MSAATATIYDVFLSHAVADAGIASFVRQALGNEGPEVFDVGEIRAGNVLKDEMRSVLAECSAVILILTRETLGSSSVAFEVGLALGWNKPIYVLFDGISPSEIPSFLKEFEVVRISEASEVAREIARSQERLNDEDRETLIETYRKLGVPTDQLLTNPATVQEITHRFHSASNARFGGEKLVHELMRLRKQGKLPKVAKKA